MDRRTLMSPESAEASDIFDKYCTANTLKGILGHYRQLCCVLRIKATHFPDFYPRLRAKLSSWRAQGLWAKFDKRASHKCYARGKACASNRVLIIGGGPCGLRAAIEAQLLGAKVVLIEKRDRFSRNNVLHIWPFVIADLKGLGAKKFYGKFCAGSIDHISIRQLQCLLLKVALLLGVEIHEGVGFEGLCDPTENEGWRAVTSPPDHPVSQYTFDCLIGADGRRNTLEGFRRKALRAKLAIAITANFINKRSEAEARVKEISGVSYIFNQKFFQDLNEATGIDLENIVYYKDETHYFVMTAKKQSLLAKGVLLHDHADTAKLLSHENISTENLMIYAVEAAIFSTENQLPNLEFAVNHYGQPDVAMFDFTAMYAAESACRVIQRKGHKLMMTLVGDSLLEPFWPTGSGCARGFLSSFDACWMLRSWASGTKSVLDVIAERESIYRLLGQTTPENLNKEHMGYTIDPHSRYPNLNLRVVMPFQVKTLYDTDEPIPDVIDGALELQQAGLERYSKKRRRDSVIAVDSLLGWLRSQVSCYGLEVEDIGDAFARGDVLCAIIHRFRPDLIEYPSPSEENVDPLEIAACRNQVAFDFLHQEYNIAPVMNGVDSVQCGSSEFLTMVAYLSQIYESFKGEIPQIKYPRVEGVEDVDDYVHRPSHVNHSRHVRTPTVVVKHGSSTKERRRNRISSGTSSRGGDTDASDTSRRQRKRRSDERSRINVGKEVKSSVGSGSDVEKQHVPGLARDLEEKLKGSKHEKKPKDLIRAIGKIEKSDWNVQLIEKKIAENKTHGQGKKERDDKVPKWSREAFDDKRDAMKRKMEGNPGDKVDERDKQFEDTVKKLGCKLKDGNALDVGQRGSNKVSQMAEQLVHKMERPNKEPDVHKAAVSRPVFEFPKKGGSETCHFCKQRVYVVERMTAEGKFFHRNCFRCEYCNTSLRLGNYAFDREGRYGERFYCTPHFTTIRAYGWRKYDALEEVAATTDRKYSGEGRHLLTPNAQQLLSEMDERGTTPERVEFENSVDFASEEELLSEMDEDEWTDRNFGASNADNNTSDEASELSDEEDEVTPEGVKEGDAVAKDPLGPDADSGAKDKGTESSDSDTEVASGEGEGSYEDGSVEDEELEDDDEGDDEEEDEEDGDDEDDEEEECGGSTTEIETDSEFAEDPPQTVPGSIPRIIVDEPEQLITRFFETPNTQASTNVNQPRKVGDGTGSKVAAGSNQPILSRGPFPKQHQQYEALRMVEPTKSVLPLGRAYPRVYPIPKKWEPLQQERPTADALTSKMSMELKKKYLYGATPVIGLSVRKSADPAAQNQLTSVLDMISEKQKLLQPAPKPSPAMQAFLEEEEKLKQRVRLLPSSLIPGISSAPQLADPILQALPVSEVLQNNSVLPTLRDDTVSMNRLNLEKTMEAERSIESECVENIEDLDSEKGDAEKDIDSAVSPRSVILTNGESPKEIEDLDGPPPPSPLLLSETPSSCSKSTTESQCTIVEAPKLETDEVEDESETESCGSVGELTCSDLGDDNCLDEVDGDGSPGICGEPPRVEIEDEFGVTLALDVEDSVKPINLKSAKNQGGSKEAEDAKAPNSYCMSSSDSKDSLTSGLFLETEMSDWMGETGTPAKKKNGRKKHSANTKSDSRALPKKDLKELDLRHKCLGLDLDGMDFMDIDGMSSPDDLIESISRKHGYAKLVDEEQHPAGSLDSGKPTDFDSSSVPESSSQCSTPVQGSESGLEELEAAGESPPKCKAFVPPICPKINEAINPALELLQQSVKLNNEKIVLLDRVGPFSNARDSLDYRKMKGVTSPTKSKDLFSTYSTVSEKPNIFSAFNATPSVSLESQKVKVSSPVLESPEVDPANKSSTSPNTTRRIDEINKERSKQNDLIRSMVMGRIRKSPEKNRKGSRGSLSPFGEASSSSTSVSESSERVAKPDATDSRRSSQNSILSHDSEPEENPPVQRGESNSASPEEPSSPQSTYTPPQPGSPSSKPHYEPLYTTPPRFRNRPKFDSPLSIYQSVTNPPTPVNPVASLFTPVTPGSDCSAKAEEDQPNISQSFYRSMPDLTAILALSAPSSKTKVNKVSSFATPSVKKWEDYKHAATTDREKARQAARERARLKSDEELGMSPTDNYGVLKDKLRRKLSVPEDDVFDPNSAITVTPHSHSEPTSAASPVSTREYSASTRERNKTRPISDLFDSTAVAASIRHNVDFPIKKNPFLVSGGSEEQRHPHYKKVITPDVSRSQEDPADDEDDFVQVQLRMNPPNQTPERRRSPEKSKSMGWDGTSPGTSPPGNFPYYFTPTSPSLAQPESVTSVRTVDPNWVLERPESMNMPVTRQRSNTYSDIFQSRDTSLPPGGSSKSPAEKRPKKSKDRDRRRSLIQAVSDFFTSRSGSSGGGSASGSLSNSITDHDKTSSTSSSSPALPVATTKDKFSLFRLTPKLLQQKDKKQSVSASKSRESLANLPPSNQKADILRITPPAKSPRASFMSYLSQPELVIQRLSSSPTPFKSSRTNLSGGPSTDRGVSLEPDKFTTKDLVKTPLTHNPGQRVTRPKNDFGRPEGRRKREIQEIQLQLESIETEQRTLESRGVVIEKKLRGEEPDEENRDDAELMEEWFTLVREKTRLARFERELIVRGQELELEDRHERVGEELDKSLLIHDEHKSPQDKTREVELFRELKAIEEQRGSLLSQFHDDMQKYESEDQELEERIKSSSISPRESNV